MVKQVIIVRKDLTMSLGKAIAQGAHASINAYKQACSIDILEWECSGHTKIVLRANNKKELIKMIEKANELDLPTSLIEDEGRTEFTEPVITCGAIGPAEADQIDKIVRRLRLY